MLPLRSSTSVVNQKRINERSQILRFPLSLMNWLTCCCQKSPTAWPTLLPLLCSSPLTNCLIGRATLAILRPANSVLNQMLRFGLGGIGGVGICTFIVGAEGETVSPLLSITGLTSSV